jgi:iron-sulfur-dependent L-serine dehydratase beta subunit
MERLPGIFNDVIGPVMRGPSSSHTAASWRIARTAIDILGEPLEKALIEFDRDGAWAPNYREQGTTMGIDGGLLELEITDERMKDTENLARQRGISIEYLVSSFPTNHANTVRLTLHGRSGKNLQMVAVSLGGRQTEMPFTTLQSLMEFAELTGSDLGKLGLIYEKCISGMDENELSLKMSEITQIIHGSIETGLKGTDYKDRILGQQSHLIGKAVAQSRIKDSVVTRTISYVTALMESKSAMEVIVAFPTAGSTGTVGGLVRAVAEEIQSTNDEVIKAYFASGIIGAWFAMGPGFSAEEYGCQVECGAASGMAAAAVVQLMGGSAKQALDAASMALQNESTILSLRFFAFFARHKIISRSTMRKCCTHK